MLIKSITAANVDSLIKIHNRTLTKEHFSSYFPESLLRKYFTELLKKNEYAIAAFDNNENMLGFIIAGTQSEKVLKKITTKNFMILLFLMLKRPYFLIEKIMQVILKLLGMIPTSNEKLRLYLIEVDHNFQGSGVGKKLLFFFENILKSHNIISYGLSVRKNNIEAVRFYERNNFQKEFTNFKSIFFVKRIINKVS